MKSVSAPGGKGLLENLWNNIVFEKEGRAWRWVATLQSLVWQLSKAGGHSLQVSGPAAHQGSVRCPGGLGGGWEAHFVQSC